MSYAIYIPNAQPAGMVVRVAATATAGEGERAVEIPEGFDPIGMAYDGARFVPIEGFFAAQTYAERRARDYPALREQLDMLYWDAVRGTTTWVDAIAAVKRRYPKA